MVVRNNSNKQLVLLNLLGEGRNLIIPPKSDSSSIIPTKKMLEILINKSDNITLIVRDPQELELLAQLDPRASDIVVCES